MDTKAVHAGGVQIGGGGKITIQSMTNTDTRDIAATSAQIAALAGAGADLVRVSVYDEECARAVKSLVASSPVPLVADIHFDHRLAIHSVENGVAKVRINPGNIGGEKNVRALADCLKAHRIPVRIGVNSGSLEKEILRKYGGVTAQGMVESGLNHAAMLEKAGFDDIVLSFKATSVTETVEACRYAAKVTDYPQHIGITESGTADTGVVKSAVGIGTLLMEGIGDTLRVSLTGDPEDEVYAGCDILRAAGFAVNGPEIISCPTCGRTQYPMIEIANEVEARLKAEGFQKPLKIAIMGCIVNGPGEASDADIGIAGGRDEALLFIHGQRVRMLKDNIVDQFIEEIHKL